MKLLSLTILSLIAVVSATTCETCQFAPDKNRCDITTSCIYVWGHSDPNTPAPNYCACRHGYRATGYDASNTEVQWRLPWTASGGGDSQQGRVFVKPGVACNTLCDQWWLGKDGCKEVAEKPACF
ncbi:hypothetical protein BKA63DRAFT_118194 [Paraphoma chrysanthemicola]|nr:hypothetical protein BKA63DRAFT_118194 [Paraphoma chrysanthemicola]